MGGEALKKVGIKTERKSTKELYDIYGKIKKYFTEYDVEMVKFYRTKKTHGDLDILLKSGDVDGVIELINNRINPNGLVVNDGVVSFDYDDFQIDIICIPNDIWKTSILFYSYDPAGMLMGKIAKGFGLSYGVEGLYYKYDKNNKIILSTSGKEIFNFLGYDLNRFNMGFDTVDNIIDFIVNGKYFDKKLFLPKNLTNVDRKRSLKRSSYRYFLKKLNEFESNYNFAPKESYIDYIDSVFPGFKDKIVFNNNKKDLRISTNKKLREVISKYKSSKIFGDVVHYFRLIKGDFNNYIIDTDVNIIKDEFDNFYRNYMELERMVDKDFGFGKRMGSDVYIHKNYETYLPYVLVDAKKLLPRNFNYTIVKWNKKTNAISFIKSVDFDSSNEPTVDDSFRVLNGEIKYRNKPKRDQIYHHKWMFVKPSYKGFDYESSKLRSLKWYKNYDYNSSMIGYKDYWNKIGINEKYNQDEIDIANKTSRTSSNPKSISNRAVVPFFVEQYASKNDLILDYGAGKYPLYTLRLRSRGYKVKAHDFGRNFTDLHDSDALEYKYDIIYASNVLNVQSNRRMLISTLKQIQGLLKQNGIFIANYPRSPRKIDMTFDELKSIISDFFEFEYLGKNTLLMRLKKLNENNIYNSKRFVDNYETFSMVIKNYDIMKDKIDNSQQYGSRGIGWDEIFGMHDNENPNYIKPYEKRRY